MPRRHGGEVIADALLQPEPRGHAETCGEIHASLMDSFVVEAAIAQNGRGGAGRLQFMGHGFLFRTSGFWGTGLMQWHFLLCGAAAIHPSKLCVADRKCRFSRSSSSCLRGSP